MMGGSSVGQQTSPLQQQPQSFQRQQSQSQAMAFPGSIPNVDWGTIDLPASAANFQLPQQPLACPETFNRGDSFPATSSGGLIPTTMLPSMGQRHGSDASSPGAGIYGSMLAGTASSSPMDALNDIDWVSTEIVLKMPPLTLRRMILSRCLMVPRWVRATCSSLHSHFHNSRPRIYSGQRRKIYNNSLVGL